MLFKKKKQEIQPEKICTANNDKPECTLIEELRQLQSQFKILNDNKVKKPDIYDFTGKYKDIIHSCDEADLIYDLRCLQHNPKYLIIMKDWVDLTNEYSTKYKEENEKLNTVSNRINEIKKQLGIE